MVDAEREVLARHGGFVVPPILIMPLRAAAHVAEHDAHALLAAQLPLVRAFHTEFADKVATLIVAVAIVFEFLLADFAHVAQHVRSTALGIVARGTLHGTEPIEAEEFFLKKGELPRGDLAHEKLRRVARITGVLGRVFNLCHAADIEISGDADRFAEVERINAALVVHHYHNIIGRLVVDEQFAVAVENQAARGVKYFFAESVGVGILLIVVAEQLQGEEAHKVHDDDTDGNAADNELSIFQLWRC